MKSTFLKWSTGNAKLRKLGTVGFNLPALRSADGFVTCPQAGACAGPCYANPKQGRWAMPAVQAACEHNLATIRATLAEGGPIALARLIVADLSRFRKLRSVRVHSSGDFFSRDYLDAWYLAARALPGIRFYAYTKAFRYVDAYRGRPRNFGIVQSAGGRDDSSIDARLPHSVIFPTNAARIAAGYVDGTVDDGAAMRGDHRIGLVYHGNATLRDSQAAALTRALPVLQ